MSLTNFSLIKYRTCVQKKSTVIKMFHYFNNAYFASQKDFVLRMNCENGTYYFNIMINCDQQFIDSTLSARNALDAYLHEKRPKNIDELTLCQQQSVDVILLRTIVVKLNI